MSYSLILRAGLSGDHQFSPRYVFASFEHAHAAAERVSVSRGTEYLIEDERGPIVYRLKGER